MIRVKICGLTNRADAEMAIAAGADALGFILYAQSQRYLTMQAALEIVRHVPPFVQTVAVTVNATREFTNLGWRKHLKAFSLVQLHGQESSVHARAVAKYLPVLKALPGNGKAEPGEYEALVTGFLLDTPTAAHGGTGRTFDWAHAVAFKAKTRRPVILSGGLTPENVAVAAARVQPYGVDVSSGVERSPGQKDPARLRDFIQICKSL